MAVGFLGFGSDTRMFSYTSFLGALILVESLTFIPGTFHSGVGFIGF